MAMRIRIVLMMLLEDLLTNQRPFLLRPFLPPLLRLLRFPLPLLRLLLYLLLLIRLPPFLLLLIRLLPFLPPLLLLLRFPLPLLLPPLLLLLLFLPLPSPRLFALRRCLLPFPLRFPPP